MDSAAKEKDDGGSDRRGRLTVMHNATIVTMDPDSRVFRNGALVVVGDSIHAIGHSSQILNDHSHLADDVIDIGSRFLLPGFINTHVHTSQQLARGIADDVDLMTWLHERIWPYESNMTEEDSYLSTLLCGLELIHSGVTCFAEAGGQHVSGMAKAVELLGIRACLTQSTMDSGHGLPPDWSTHSTDYCIESQRSLYGKHHNTANGRIRIWFGLRQIMNASDRLLTETRDIAKELKTGIHMHVAEISYENEFVVKTRGVDHGTVTYLQKVGLLQDNLLAAHSVWVNETEIGFLSKAGVKVSHCPAAAMRMLGFAPIKEMLDAGICVSLGTDGAPSNNRMSIVDEMYLASLVNKGREAFFHGVTDPTVLPAEVVLEMATINGAKAVLWNNEIGSLEVGKKADLVTINPLSWSMIPVHDSISSLVYCMRTENIDSVMCNGQWIMKDRKILTLNEAYECLSDKDKRTAFNSLGCNGFCKECVTKAQQKTSTTEKKRSSSHKSTEQTRPHRVLQALREAKKKLQEEARVIERCLRNHNGKSKDVSPLFNPSEYLVLHGYPHNRRVQAPRGYWYLRPGCVKNNGSGRRQWCESPVYEITSDNHGRRTRSGVRF